MLHHPPSTNKLFADNTILFKNTLLQKQLILEQKDFLKLKRLKVYNSPLTQYLRYNKKKRLYQQIYHNSHLRYYFLFLWQLTSKIIRKKLLSNIANISINFLLIYILDNTGILNILYRKLKRKI